MADEGFFGPDSIAWKVHAHPSSIVGGIRSLMVQSLEPRAMAGVAQHSDFRVDFWGRLRRTNDFLMKVVFGTRVDAERASEIVRAVHARVTGFDNFTQRSYRADETELLGWVHNATLESYLTGYNRHSIALTRTEEDRYVDEMSVLGRLMGLSSTDVPRDVTMLRRYFEALESQLAATEDAKTAVRVLLNPQLPLHIKPLWNLPAADAFASLPAAYRSLFGFPWCGALSPGLRLGTNVMLNGLRILLPPPPPVEAAYARTAA